MVVLEKLSRRADQLEEALGLFNSLSNEAGGVLEQLSSRLESLTELTAPIHTRSFALTAAQTNVIKTKREVDKLLESLDTSRKLQPQVEKGAQRDLDTFLQNLQELERSLAYLQQHSQLASARQALAHAQTIFERAMQECSTDFITALQQGSAAALPSAATITKLALEKLHTTTDRSRLTVDLLPKQALPKIIRLATTVLQAKPNAAVEMYVSVRDRSIEQVLRNLALENPAAIATASAEQLGRIIQSWCLQLRALLVLAISEQQLADTIWPAPHAATASTAVVTRHMRNLLQLGKDIIETKRTPDKVFAFLDMHQHLDTILPLMGAVLGGADATAAQHAELIQLQAVVARAARVTFTDFEDQVSRDQSKTAVADGTVHPLCAHVTSYIKKLFTYNNAAQVLFGEGGSSSGRPGSEAGGNSGVRGAMSVALMRIMMHLLENLEAKAKAFKSEPLSPLFLMNNVHYMVWTVEQSPAAELLGTQWVERHKDFVEAYGEQYHNTVWMPLVRLLQAPAPEATDKVKAMLKERFKKFNEGLEGIYLRECAWTIPDAQLRSAVKRVIKQDLLPPYREFMRKYADVPFTSNPAKYIKYSADDVDRIVDEDLHSSKPGSLSKLAARRQGGN